MTNLSSDQVGPLMSYSAAIGYARRRRFSIYGMIFFRSIKQQTTIIQYGVGWGGGGGEWSGGVYWGFDTTKKINAPLIEDPNDLIISSKDVSIVRWIQLEMMIQSRQN